MRFDNNQHAARFAACGSIGIAVMVYPDGTLYAHIQPSDAAEIVEQHIEKGNVVKRLALMELKPAT